MERDVLRAGEQFLAEKDWDLVRRSVPILCVDILLAEQRSTAGGAHPADHARW